MELLNIKKGTKVVITDDNVKTPPASPVLSKGDVINIGWIDGMYCNGYNESGERVYFAAWTEVEVL